MFCKNCGDLLDDGALFCTKCGQRVEAETATEVREEAAPAMEQAPVELAEQKPQEPAKSKKPFIIGIVAVVLVIALGVVFANFQVVANSFMKLVLSPEKYYAHIEKKEVKEMASELAVSVDNSAVGVVDTSDMSGRYVMDLELGEVIYESLGDSLGLEDASGLSKIGLDFFISVKEDVYSGELAARLGQNRLVSVNAIGDLEKGMVYAQVPELSERYISADVSEELDSMTEAMEQYTSSSSFYPEGEVIEELLNRYVGIMIEHVQNVTEEKETLTVGEIEQKCTVLSASMTQVEAITMMEAVFTEAKSDEELLDLLAECVAYVDSTDVQTERQAIVEAIEDYLAEADSYKEDASENSMLTLRVWVSNKGEVVGRELTLTEDDIVFAYQMPQKGKEFAYQLKMGSVTDIIEISGAGTKTASDMTGEFAVKLDSDETGAMNLFTLTIERLDLDKWEEGYLDIRCSLKPDRDLYTTLIGVSGALFTGYELVYEAQTDKTGEAGELSLVNGEEMIFKLTASTKLDKAQEVSMPTDSILIEGDEDLMTWIATMDFDKFMENIEQSDMPAELVEMIEAYVNEFESMMSYY